MTRKDYELIAGAIAATKVRVMADENISNFKSVEQSRGVRRTAANLADALAKDNPSFDAQRFLTACGYGANGS